MTPTIEQLAISTQQRDFFVEAGAGCTKSSSMVFTALQNQDKNYLVVTFNRKNANEGNSNPNKPANIHYATFHEIAREYLPTQLINRAKNYLDWTDCPGDEVYWELKKLGTWGRGRSGKWVNKRMQQIVTDFCKSCSDSIAVFVKTHPALAEFKEYHQVAFQKAVLAYWLDLTETKGKLTISHDVYAKLFAVSETKLVFWKGKPLHVLVWDEFQDTNEMMVDFFLKQTHLQRIALGDPLQMLYEFNGAGRGFADIPENWPRLTLSESFRYPQSIADDANKILALAGSSMKLVGRRAENCEIDSIAILCRTNAGCLEKALEFIELGTKVNLTIDLKKMKSEAYHLLAALGNRTIQYPAKGFERIRDKASALEEIEHVDEIANLSNLLKKFGLPLAEFFSKLEESLSSDGILISTVHKAKGLEWDEVYLHDDLLKLKEGQTIQEKLEKTKDLLACLYVAITRAKVRYHGFPALEALLSGNLNYLEL